MTTTRELIVYENANTVAEIEDDRRDPGKVFVRFIEELGTEQDEKLIEAAKARFDGISRRAIMVIRTYVWDDAKGPDLSNWGGGKGEIVSTTYEVLASK